MYKQDGALHPLLLMVILLLMTLEQMITDQYVPSLPAITQAFSTNKGTIQLTLTFFMLGLCLSHLCYGPLSDKIGRRPPLMFGVGLSILGSLLCFVAPSVQILIAGRFLQGFGIGSCNSVGRSLVRDLFTDRLLAKIGSYIGILSVFIMVSSPTLGGYIQEHFGWRANFLFLFTFGIVVWFIALFLLPETNTNLNPDATRLRVMACNYLALLRSKVFLGYALCSCFAFSGIISYLTIGPFIFQNALGLSPLQFGQLSIFIAGAICVSGIANSQLVMSKGIPFMVGTGVCFMVVGGSSLLIFSLMEKAQVLYIMIPMALFSIGAGFTFINAFAGAFHPFPMMAGTVGALYSSMQDLTAALSSGVIAASKISSQSFLGGILFLLGIGSSAAWYYLAIREE